MAIRFGVIFIDNNIDNFFNDRRKTKQQLIRSILERKSGLDFIRFIEATASYTNLERKRKLSFEECAVFYTDADFVRIEREITSFLVFQNDRSVTLNNDLSATFNLKNYLLVLAKKFYCSVCYCENINTQKIEWISTNHSDFGEILQEFSDITSLSPNEFTHVINQKKGEAFDHILINDIKYNLLDNTFHFIFNVGNSLLKESSQLIIEVPREALDLENVDRLIENTLSSHRVCFCSEIHSVCSENSLICHLNQGSYIIDLHLIDD